MTRTFKNTADLLRAAAKGCRKGWLVLTRQHDQSTIIRVPVAMIPPGAKSVEIEVKVVDIRPCTVRLGFLAPRFVSVHREEIQHEIDAERTQKHGAQSAVV